MFRRLLSICIRFYQAVISPHVGDCCRFEPSCSDYCLQAIEQHGAFRGLFLGIKRLLRCHPFGTAGYDPVPQNPQKKSPFRVHILTR